MDDLISRQAAIELIHTLYPSAPIMRMNRKWWKKKYKPYIEAEKALEMLPSAQQERPTGEWIVSESEEVGALGIRCRTYTCPSCGWDNSLIIPRNFCPNCGARMA